MIRQEAQNLLFHPPTSPTRFDDYKEVNICNHCEHYYTSACDGKCKKLSENSSENAPDDFCKAFVPIRGDLIQEEIVGIKRHLRGLDWILIILVTTLLLDSLGVF